MYCLICQQKPTDSVGSMHTWNRISVTAKATSARLQPYYLRLEFWAGSSLRQRLCPPTLVRVSLKRQSPVGVRVTLNPVLGLATEQHVLTTET